MILTIEREGIKVTVDADDVLAERAIDTFERAFDHLPEILKSIRDEVLSVNMPVPEPAASETPTPAPPAPPAPPKDVPVIAWDDGVSQGIKLPDGRYCIQGYDGSVRVCASTTPEDVRIAFFRDWDSHGVSR